jgi:hypothetical protein
MNPEAERTVRNPGITRLCNEKADRVFLTGAGFSEEYRIVACFKRD